MKNFNSMADDYQTSQSNLMATEGTVAQQQQQATGGQAQQQPSRASSRQQMLLDEMSQDLNYLNRDAPLDGGESTFGVYSQIGGSQQQQQQHHTSESVMNMEDEDMISSNRNHLLESPEPLSYGGDNSLGRAGGSDYAHNEQVLSQLSPDNVDIQKPLQQTGPFDDKKGDEEKENEQTSELTKTTLPFKPFLVSFMVDARGGAMRGCRHSGVRVIIPPESAQMPMRITCRYLRRERLVHPPPLMEGEACASKIMEIGPAGAKFLGPVLIEVPHFASLRGQEREIIILRSDRGEVWREHLFEADDKLIESIIQSAEQGGPQQAPSSQSQENINSSSSGNNNNNLINVNSAVDKRRLTRIVTNEFPQYFAIISRIRQQVHPVGPEGSTVNSQVVPRVQAIFTEGALTKRIKIGLQPKANNKKQQKQQAQQSDSNNLQLTSSSSSNNDQTLLDSQAPRSVSPTGSGGQNQLDSLESGALELNHRASSPAQQSQQGSQQQQRPSSAAKRRSRFLACFGARQGSADLLDQGTPTSLSDESSAGGDSPRSGKNSNKRLMNIELDSDGGELLRSSPSPASLEENQLVPDDYYIEQEPPLILNVEPKTYGKRLASSSAQTDNKSVSSLIMSTSTRKQKKRGLLRGKRKNKTQLTIHCDGPTTGSARAPNRGPVNLNPNDNQLDSSLELQAEQITSASDDRDSSILLADVIQGAGNDSKWRTCTIQTDSDSVTVNYVTIAGGLADQVNSAEMEKAAQEVTATSTKSKSTSKTANSSQVQGDDGYVSGSGDNIKQTTTFGKSLFGGLSAFAGADKHHQAQLSSKLSYEEERETKEGDEPSDEQLKGKKKDKKKAKKEAAKLKAATAAAAAKSKNKNKDNKIGDGQKESISSEMIEKLDSSNSESKRKQETISSATDNSLLLIEQKESVGEANELDSSSKAAKATVEGESASSLEQSKAEQVEKQQQEELRSVSPSSKELKQKLKLEKQERLKREKEEKRIQKELEDAAAKAEKLKKKQEKEAKKAEKLAQKMAAKKATSSSPTGSPEPQTPLPADNNNNNKENEQLKSTTTTTTGQQQVKFATDLISEPKQQTDLDEQDSHLQLKQLDSIQRVINETTDSYEKIKERLSQEDGHDMVRVSISEKLTDEETGASLEPTANDTSEKLISFSDSEDLQAKSPPADNSGGAHNQQEDVVVLKPILKQQSSFENQKVVDTDESQQLSTIARKLVDEATNEAVESVSSSAAVESSPLDKSSSSEPTTTTSKKELEKEAKRAKKEEKERLKREAKAKLEEEKRSAKEAKRLAKEAEEAKKKEEAELKKAAKIAKEEAKKKLKLEQKLKKKDKDSSQETTEKDEEEKKPEKVESPTSTSCSVDVEATTITTTTTSEQVLSKPTEEEGKEEDSSEKKEDEPSASENVVVSISTSSPSHQELIKDVDDEKKSEPIVSFKEEEGPKSEESKTDKKEGRKKKAKKTKKEKTSKSSSLATDAPSDDANTQSESTKPLSKSSSSNKSSFFSRLFKRSSSASSPSDKKVASKDLSSDKENLNDSSLQTEAHKSNEEMIERKKSHEVIMSEMYPRNPDDADGEMILEVNVPKNLIEQQQQQQLQQISTSQMEDVVKETVDALKRSGAGESIDLASEQEDQTTTMPTTTTIDESLVMSEDRQKVDRQPSQQDEPSTANKIEREQQDQGEEATLVNISQMITSEAADNDDLDDATENVVSQATNDHLVLVQESPEKVLESTREQVVAVDDKALQREQKSVNLAGSGGSLDLKEEKTKKELEAKLEKESKKRAKEEEKLEKKRAKEEKLKADREKKLAELEAKKRAKEEKERAKRELKEAKKLAQLAKKQRKKDEQKEKKKSSSSTVAAAATSGEAEQQQQLSNETIVIDESSHKDQQQEGEQNTDEPKIVDTSNMKPVKTETEVQRIVEEVVGEDGVVTKTTKTIETKYVTLRQEEIQMSEHKQELQPTAEIVADAAESIKRTSSASSLSSGSSIDSQGERKTKSLKKKRKRSAQQEQQDEVALVVIDGKIKTTDAKQQKVTEELEKILSTPSYFSLERPAELADLKKELSAKKELKQRIRLNEKLIKKAYKLAKVESKIAKKNAQLARAEIAVCDEAAKEAEKELKRALKESKRATKMAAKEHKKMDKIDKKLSKRQKKIEKRQVKLDKKAEKLAKKAEKNREKLAKKEAKLERKTSQKSSSSNSKKSIKLEDIGAPVLRSSSRMSIGADGSQQLQQVECHTTLTSNSNDVDGTMMVNTNNEQTTLSNTVIDGQQQRGSPASDNDEMIQVEMSLDDNDHQHDSLVANNNELLLRGDDQNNDELAEGEGGTVYTVTSETVTVHPDGQVSKEVSESVLHGKEAELAAERMTNQTTTSESDDEQVDVVNDLPVIKGKQQHQHQMNDDQVD